MKNSAFLLFLAVTFLACQEPYDGNNIIQGKFPIPNPLIDSVASVNVYGMRDAATFVTYLDGNIRNEKNGVQTFDSFAFRTIGVEVFDTKPGDSLTAQAARAGITADSALAIGRAAALFADSLLYRDIRISRDPRYPNIDARGEFLRHVSFIHRKDSMLVEEDYATLLKERGFTIP